MREVDEGQESKDGKQEKHVSKKGEAAAKGGPENLTPQQNAKILHDGYGDRLFAKFDNTEGGVDVFNEETVTRPDGTEGRIDTRINENILDYKTHDQSKWTKAKAAMHGHEHGKQVQGYVNSEDTPSDAKGTVIATGNPPSDSAAQNKYVETLAEYDIDVKYTPGGGLDDVENAASYIMKGNKKNSK